jgi:hypothetical protein
MNLWGIQNYTLADVENLNFILARNMHEFCSELKLKNKQQQK